jgi:NAD(P)-dependent dehydrogenase (short-subunit alcohol dehydrogenase family)
MVIREGNTAFITGGAGGIGFGIAQVCGEFGMNLVIGDINSNRLQAALQQLPGARIGILMDVSNPSDWRRARSEAEKKFGKVDLLVNNAAIAPAMAPVIDLSVEQFDRIVATNLSSVFYGVKTFASAMRDRGDGQILNTASQAGLLPMPKIGDYVATKFGVIGLSDTLRLELAPSGVGVSVLIPGLVHTNMTVGMGMEPIWVARAAVDGLRENRPYIFSHPNCREALERRHSAMMACIGEYAQPGYTEALWTA